MRLYLEIWGRLKNGKCLIEVAEFGVEEEELTRTVIWNGFFNRKKGETLMDFSRRFFETEIKEKYGHPTAKPEDIIETLIANSCPAGGGRV